MRFKEVKKLINEQQEAEQLFEVNMSPSNLKQLASKIDARAGMEFEMIVPDAEGGDDSGDMEPDYDMDESVRDIEDACNFFSDGDYNDRRAIDRLRSSMEEDFQIWQMEQIDDAWNSGEGYEFFTQYVDVNDSFDREEGLDEAQGYVKENHPDVDPNSDEYQELVSNRLQELETEFVQEEWNMEGRSYDYAREEFEDEKRGDYEESDWLQSADLNTMHDISRNYDVEWPHWMQQGGGSREIADIADNFSRAIGRPVNYSTSYHGARRQEGHYVVEPDGSLQGDNPGDAGLEFVSPPLPLSELLSDLEKVKKWAKSEGAYTGEDFNTGLHINVSVPGLGSNQENLDYVKLALLLGDEHVLKEFERLGNTYCKSGLDIVKKNIKNDPENAKKLLDQMKSGLEQMASRAVHGAITNKFTSINTKDGYVEFRSPGGDWLDDKFDKIEPTLLRFVVALDAAVKPDLYRQEYLKKLYKALEPAGNKNTIEYFTKYVAGEMPKAALKSFVRQAQLERSIERDPNKGKGKWWWNVAIDGQRVEVVANDSFGAWQAAIDTNPEWMRFNRANAEIKPLRPYEEKPEAQQPAQQDNRTYRITSTGGTLIAGDEYGSDQEALQRAQYWAQRRGVDVIVRNPQGEEVGRVSAFGEITPAAQSDSTGNWGIWLTSSNRFVRAPGQLDNSVLRRFPSREAAEQFLAQTRAERPDMRTDIEVREIEPAEPIPGSTLDLQRQRAAQQDVDTRVDYEIYNRTTGEVIRQFQARNDDEAMVAVDDYRDHGNHGLARNVADHQFGVRRGPGVTNTAQQSSVNNLTPHGPGPWEIYRISDNSAVRALDHTNRAAAETEARAALRIRSEAPELYGVRTRQQTQTVPQTLTRPGQGQQVFTGEWKIVDDSGQELHRFGGIGNVQSDANRVAAQWIQRNPTVVYSGGISVLPVMGPA